MQLFANEVHYAEKLRHKRLAETYEANHNVEMQCPETGLTKSVSYITSELCTRGELFSYISSSEGALPAPVCKYYFRQLL